MPETNATSPNTDGTTLKTSGTALETIDTPGKSGLNFTVLSAWTEEKEKVCTCAAT